MILEVDYYWFGSYTLVVSEIGATVLNFYLFFIYFLFSFSFKRITERNKAKPEQIRIVSTLNWKALTNNINER